MLGRFKGRNPDDEVTIDDDTKVSMKGLFASIVATALFVTAWGDLHFQQVETRKEIQSVEVNFVSEKQQQEWLDNARELNPALKWPRLPDKKASSAPSPAIANGETAISVMNSR